MAFVLGVFTFINELWLGLALSALYWVFSHWRTKPLIQQQTPPEMHGVLVSNNAVNIALARC